MAWLVFQKAFAACLLRKRALPVCWLQVRLVFLPMTEDPGLKIKKKKMGCALPSPSSVCVFACVQGIRLANPASSRTWNKKRSRGRKRRLGEMLVQVGAHGHIEEVLLVSGWRVGGGGGCPVAQTERWGDWIMVPGKRFP